MSMSRLLWSDRRGVAALEFALMAPVLVLVLLFGTIEIARAVRAATLLNLASNSAAQMVGQMTDMTSTSLGDVCKASALLMNRFNAANAATSPPLSLSIAYVTAKGKANPNDTTYVATLNWRTDTACAGTTGSMTTAPVTAASPLLLKTGDKVVVVQANYAYTPLFTSFLSTKLGTTLTRASYAPGLFTTVTCSGC